MCTLILLRRPDHDWPLLLAANRDEMTARPWLSPARHWHEYPNVVAGADQLAGGSWLGLNDECVVAIVMNRYGTLGPQAGRRSRGELVLKALAYGGATEAATALAELKPALYRSFNLVVADRNEAFWLCHRGDEKQDKIEVHALLTGISMLTNRDCNDLRSSRIRTYLPRFRSALPPDPEIDNGWSAWIALLASQPVDHRGDPQSAMTVATQRGFATVSSSLIALPATSREDLRPSWRFASDRPDRTEYRPVSI